VLLAAAWRAEATVTLDKLDTVTASRVKSAMDVALTPLRFSQSTTEGSYGDELTTALAVRAFMESHRRYTEEDGPFITRALDILSSESEGPGRWVARLVLSRSLKKPDPTRWPAELMRELGPSSKLSDGPALAFAVEAVLASGAPLDDKFWQTVAPKGGSAASDYVLALAARSGHGDPQTVARAVASRCAQIGSGAAPYQDRYFLAATLETLSSDPRASDVPADCAGALAQELQSRQAFEGFWLPAPEEDGDKRRTTALAVLALAKLVEIQ
jgi:hypothetical protein